MLALKIGKPHYLVNNGVSGRRSDKLITKYKNNGFKCDADLIIVICSKNDVKQNVTTATYKTNLGLLIDEMSLITTL